MSKRLFLFVLTAIFTSALFGFSCGGGGSSDNENNTNPTVSESSITAKILLGDDTTKDLSESPIPLTARVQITFLESVQNTSSIEESFSLMEGNRKISSLISWDEDSTVMTVKPINGLDYQKTYSISFSSTETGAGVTGLNIKDTSGESSLAFTTMLDGDINGDGKADVIANAECSDSDTTDEVDECDILDTAYLFYGDTISSRSFGEAEAVISGNSSSADMNCSTHDINDDGYTDIYCYIDDEIDSFYFFYGKTGDVPFSGSLNMDNADFSISGTQYDDYDLNISFGDINGDNHTDLIFAPNSCGLSSACAFIFFGPSFESKETYQSDSIIGRGSIDSPGKYTNLDSGDVNGDGYTDIAFGESYYVETEAGKVSKSRVVLVYGKSGFINTDADDADLIVDTEDSHYNKITLVGLTDTNNDGLSDLIVWEQNNNNRPMVYVFNGMNFEKQKYNPSEANITYSGTGNGEGITNNNIHLEVEDFTNDGTKDIVLFLVNNLENNTYIFLGDNGFEDHLVTQADYILSNEILCQAYFSTHSAGKLQDVNGDGLFDIVTCGTGLNIYYSNTGGTNLLDAPDATIQGVGSINYFQDVNGDGLLDIIAWSPSHDSSRIGSLYVIYGMDSLVSGHKNELADIVIMD